MEWWRVGEGLNEGVRNIDVIEWCLGCLRNWKVYINYCFIDDFCEFCYLGCIEFFIHFSYLLKITFIRNFVPSDFSKRVFLFRITLKKKKKKKIGD